MFTVKGIDPKGRALTFACGTDEQAMEKTWELQRRGFREVVVVDHRGKELPLPPSNVRLRLTGASYESVASCLSRADGRHEHQYGQQPQHQAGQPRERDDLGRQRRSAGDWCLSSPGACRRSRHVAAERVGSGAVDALASWQLSRCGSHSPVGPIQTQRTAY